MWFGLFYLAYEPLCSMSPGVVCLVVYTWRFPTGQGSFPTRHHPVVMLPLNFFLPSPQLTELSEVCILPPCACWGDWGQLERKSIASEGQAGTWPYCSHRTWAASLAMPTASLLLSHPRQSDIQHFTKCLLGSRKFSFILSGNLILCNFYLLIPLLSSAGIHRSPSHS